MDNEMAMKPLQQDQSAQTVPQLLEVGPCQQPLLAPVTEENIPKARYRYDTSFTKCLRGILYLYNICLFMLGCAAIGLGVWLLQGDIKVQYLTLLVGRYQYLSIATYLLTAGGAASVIVAALGIFGTHQENKYVLAVYGTLMFLVLIVFGTSSKLSILSKDIVAEGIKARMRETLTSSYGLNIRQNQANKQMTEAWDYMQSKFECCGVSGNTTSTDSWALYMTSSLWYIEQMRNGQRSQKVPFSCCKGEREICTGQVYWPGPPNHLNPPKEKHKKENPYLHTTGCFDQLVHFLMTYSTVVPKFAGFASSLYFIFGITSFIVSICLLSFTRLESR